MKTLVIRAPHGVENPDNFKKLGFSTFRYNLLNPVNPTEPPIMGVRTTKEKTIIQIEGAIIYKAGNGSAINFSTPYDGEVEFDANVTGIEVFFAFVPSKQSGAIRISNQGGDAMSWMHSPYTRGNVEILLEPSELKDTREAFNDFTPPNGNYKPKFTLIGDINGFSENTKLVNFSIQSNLQVKSDLRNKYWKKELPSTVEDFSVFTSTFDADIDLSIFEKHVPASIIILNNNYVRMFGNVNKILSSGQIVGINGNNSHDGLFGTINSLGVNIKTAQIKAPNLAGGYTTRTFTTAGSVSIKIDAPKVSAADWDLLLSDLANKAPNISGGVVQVNKRTSASDASIATLTSKSISVIVGF